MQPLTPIEAELIARWQRGLPLVERPYAAMSGGTASEAEVIEALRALSRKGVLSRVGATLRPNTVGASLLAAMRVPAARLEDVAALVNAEPGVNHNYEREHDFNLWFVVTGRDRAALDAALARIRIATGLGVLELPLEKGYHIDLGFPLDAPRHVSTTARVEGDIAALDTHDRCVLETLEDGLPLEPRPFAALGARCGFSEDEVIASIGRAIAAGVVTRFGLIVRHRPLGITANAMAVWDIPGAEVDAVGARLAAEPAVNLCYRRPRRLPDWPYNLFAMVHGRERAAVLGEIAAMKARAGLEGRPSAVLFSTRCFRQRGPSLRAA